MATFSLKSMEELTKELLTERFAGITDATPANISRIYEALDFLGIPFKKTTCRRCRADLLLILKEELGLIESAAGESPFNSDGKVCYTYTCDRPQTWNGYVIDNSTPVEIIRKFIGRFPVGYYAVGDCPHEDGPTGECEGHKVVPHPDMV